MTQVGTGLVSERTRARAARSTFCSMPEADPGASGATAPVVQKPRLTRVGPSCSADGWLPRAERSPRYRWWALIALLAGLLSLNITFTVFVVALPTVKADFHTNFSVLTWASTGPLLAFGIAAPFFGKAGDLFGHRRLYLFGCSGPWSAPSSRPRQPTWACSSSPAPSTACRARPPARRRWR